MLSVTRRHRDTVSPRPTPGKMNALFPCPIRNCLPRYETGANGLPVATMARPSDHRTASFGVHSDFAVGLDSGKMIGRGLLADMRRITFSVKVPGTPEVPRRTVGRACV